MVKKNFLVSCPFCLRGFPLLQTEDGSKLCLRTPSANQCGPLEMDVVCKGGFTPNEQYTLMSLWDIGRSPLIIGDDMIRLDAFTKELLTTPEMLKVNRQSTNNRQFSRENNLIVWVADIPVSKDKYVAFFNAQGKESSDAIVSEISIDLTQLGFRKKVKVRNLWQHKDLDKFKGSFSKKNKTTWRRTVSHYPLSNLYIISI